MAILSLHTLRVIHPMSACADDEPGSAFRPGNLVDSLSGEASETVEVQVLGYHESRQLDRRKDYPTDIYPEFEAVEVDAPACISSNGHTATVGLYTDRACARCPHALTRCALRVNAWTRFLGTSDEKIRELLFKSKSLPTWSEIEFETQNDEVPFTWHVVLKLRGKVVKAGPGKASVFLLEGVRPATADEVAAAERMWVRISSTLTKLSSGGAVRALPASTVEEPESVEPEPVAAASGNGKGRRS
jgi:hypothetical protein